MYKIGSESLWDKITLGKLGNMIAGPCAVESTSQLEKVSAFLVEKQVKILRAGAYKPRTSPKTFQGLGKDGVKIIHETCEKYGLISVTEIMDIRDLEYMEQMVDILQVGSRNMFNYSMLKELGKTDKPILLKRGLMATIEEFICAAEYIQNEGNTKIIMCERGIRTFEHEIRNTLDLSCVALLKQKTNYPVVVDLSHSLGRKDIMIPMAKASLAVGADMIMVEVHPEPEKALSDAKQQLNLGEFENLLVSI
ncbi:bifunctional 3-deoxy-7-phosphoheptulonate synthase/chorismate mutase [Lacrimispora sp. BS-2]|uniref:Bifunctional 3-deoxy-7-phosphoheptulonate synthase/chorismate mutase n=1 Tax=Lacrimispora sp. BS-2 TaxID=3151850 RepID=A0AAU7PMY7_9FIRM